MKWDSFFLTIAGRHVVTLDVISDERVNVTRYSRLLGLTRRPHDQPQLYTVTHEKNKVF
jgi:hypothetical protein